MNNWESELGVLYKASKIPIEEFVSGKSSKKNVIRNMIEKNLLTPEIESEINEMYKKIDQLSLTPIVSVHTPIDGKFRREFDLV